MWLNTELGLINIDQIARLDVAHDDDGVSMIYMQDQINTTVVGLIGPVLLTGDTDLVMKVWGQMRMTIWSHTRLEQPPNVFDLVEAYHKATGI